MNHDVTRLLTAIEQGDPAAADQLLPLVYQELRKLASARLSSDRTGETIQPTVLVHEAYLRLVHKDREQPWNGCGHFFAAAAEAMRRILIENIRRKRTQKRAAVFEDRDVTQVAAVDDRRSLDLLALDEALTDFEPEFPDRAWLVKLRYFAGLTMQEAAEAMDISAASAGRYWTFARTWLHVRMKDQP